MEKITATHALVQENQKLNKRLKESLEQLKHYKEMYLGYKEMCLDMSLRQQELEDENVVLELKAEYAVAWSTVGEPADPHTLSPPGSPRPPIHGWDD